MTSTGEDIQYRTTPDDGHALLLMEAKGDQRTFSDYPNIVSCLDKISDLYEKSRVASNLTKDDYDIDQLWDWIEMNFCRLEIFIFDKGIARYKRARNEELRELFIEQLRKIASQKSDEL